MLGHSSKAQYGAGYQHKHTKSDTLTKWLLGMNGKQVGPAMLAVSLFKFP